MSTSEEIPAQEKRRRELSKSLDTWSGCVLMIAQKLDMPDLSEESIRTARITRKTKEQHVLFRQLCSGMAQIDTLRQLIEDITKESDRPRTADATEVL